MRKLFVVISFFLAINSYSQKKNSLLSESDYLLSKENLLDSLKEYRLLEKTLRHVINTNYISFKIKEAEQNELVDSLKTRINFLENKLAETTKKNKSQTGGKK